jgi:hypothetical protein
MALTAVKPWQAKQRPVYVELETGHEGSIVTGEIGHSRPRPGCR